MRTNLGARGYPEAQFAIGSTLRAAPGAYTKLYADRMTPLFCRTRAYTMLELLIAIVILFALAAVLIPVLQKERQEGWAATCLSNEHQLGMAIMQYAHDNDEFLPNLYTWKYRSLPGID